MELPDLAMLPELQNPLILRRNFSTWICLQGVAQLPNRIVLENVSQYFPQTPHSHTF